MAPQYFDLNVHDWLEVLNARLSEEGLVLEDLPDADEPDFLLVLADLGFDNALHRTKLRKVVRELQTGSEEVGSPGAASISSSARGGASSCGSPSRRRRRSMPPQTTSHMLAEEADDAASMAGRGVSVIVRSEDLMYTPPWALARSPDCEREAKVETPTQAVRWSNPSCADHVAEHHEMMLPITPRMPQRDMRPSQDSKDVQKEAPPVPVLSTGSFCSVETTSGGEIGGTQNWGHNIRPNVHARFEPLQQDLGSAVTTDSTYVPESDGGGPMGVMSRMQKLGTPRGGSVAACSEIPQRSIAGPPPLSFPMKGSGRQAQVLYLMPPVKPGSHQGDKPMAPGSCVMASHGGSPVLVRRMQVPQPRVRSSSPLHLGMPGPRPLGQQAASACFAASSVTSPSRRLLMVPQHSGSVPTGSVVLSTRASASSAAEA